MTCAACAVSGLIVGLWLGVFGSVLMVAVVRSAGRDIAARRGLRL